MNTYYEVVGKDIAIVQLPDMSKALALPVQDLSDIIDSPNMWGSRVYGVYDFSQDEDQNTVMISLEWSEMDKDACNENAWVNLKSSFVEDGERYYVGTLDIGPMFLDVDAIVKEFDVDDITEVPIIFKARDIFAVVDREGLNDVLEAQGEGRLPKMGTPEWESLSREAKLFIAHAGRKEGVIPETRVLN